MPKNYIGNKNIGFSLWIFDAAYDDSNNPTISCNYKLKGAGIEDYCDAENIHYRVTLPDDLRKILRGIVEDSMSKMYSTLERNDRRNPINKDNGLTQTCEDEIRADVNELLVKCHNAISDYQEGYDWQQEMLRDDRQEEYAVLKGYTTITDENGKYLYKKITIYGDADFKIVKSTY